jgi:hypothetical protein
MVVVIVSTCAICLINEGIICLELNGRTLNVSMYHNAFRVIHKELVKIS